MLSTKPRPSITATKLLATWGRILIGRVPLLSIEITKECPLRCPGCYAYDGAHLGGEVTLRQLNDLRGEALISGVVGLVRKHKPMHVSLVGGEPLVRHRELSRILPALSDLGVFTLVVTSAVLPIPLEWMSIPRLRIAVSVDGLPEDHDIRRKPATYDLILQHIQARVVNIHWVITRPMLNRPNYLQEYVAFWNARPEINRIWVSLYTPQVGEESPEKLTPEDRVVLARELPALARHYPKLLMNEGVSLTFISPPKDPTECIFARMSINVSADLQSRIEPCVFGGTPDCSQCGCAISSGAHWFRTIKIAGPLKVGHLVEGSIAAGLLVNRFRSDSNRLSRWRAGNQKSRNEPEFVQIQPQ